MRVERQGAAVNLGHIEHTLDDLAQPPALLVLGDKVGVPRPSSGSDKAEQISETTIQKMAEDLQANSSVLRYLKNKRGLTDATIKILEAAEKKFDIKFDLVFAEVVQELLLDQLACKRS